LKGTEGERLTCGNRGRALEKSVRKKTAADNKTAVKGVREREKNQRKRTKQQRVGKEMLDLWWGVQRTNTKSATASNREKKGSLTKTQKQKQFRVQTKEMIRRPSHAKGEVSRVKEKSQRGKRGGKRENLRKRQSTDQQKNCRRIIALTHRDGGEPQEKLGKKRSR